MKIKYDAEVDVLVIRLRDGKYEESDEVANNVIMDFDAEGNALALEILNAKTTLGDLSLNVEMPLETSVAHDAKGHK